MRNKLAGILFLVLCNAAFVSARQIRLAGNTPANISLAFFQQNPSVNLAWDASIGAEGYTLYRSQQSNQYSLNPLATVLVPETTFTDNTVTDGQTYFYVVRAKNSTGESANSNEVRVAVATTTLPLPAAPTGIMSRCAPDGKTLFVSWVNEPSAKFSYLRAVDATTVTDIIYLDRITEMSFNIPTVPGQTIRWWVHAANDSPLVGPEGWGAGIGPATSATITCMAPPINLRIQ